MINKPRTPVAVLELRGAFKQNPQRKAERENEPDPSGPISRQAPDYMTSGQEKCYLELIEHCNANVLGFADSAIVEVAACLLDEFREDPREINPSKLSRLMTSLSLLGMTPADRSRVTALRRDGKKSKYSEFAA